MKTIAVIEGFAGGPRSSANFRIALVKAGFKVIKDKQKADIVVAHSAGIYAVPPDANAKLLLLIGPTFWPGRNVMARLARHYHSSGRYHYRKFGLAYYIRKRAREVYYFFARNKYMWLGLRHNNRMTHIKKLSAVDRRIIVVRNDDDPFNTPELGKWLSKHKNVRLVKLPGVHDDYYTNPAPYIDLLRKEL